MSVQTPDLEAFARAAPPVRRRAGRIVAADGATVTIAGLADRARLGDPVHIGPSLDEPGLTGEIVSLEQDVARAMTVGGGEGVALGDLAWLAPHPVLRPTDAWRGRVIGCDGRPLDGRPLPQGTVEARLRAPPPAPARRAGLGGRLTTGLMVTDTILPIARGQRLGLFAGSGVGKSQLLSTLARRVEADVVVFGLIGERGRELNEFIREGLGTVGFSRAVIVAATSDESPLNRRRAAWTAMSVAESFRDQGRHVLLLLDSLTRFAEAHREIALTAGETPSLRAFPPSTASLIAGLAERAGPGEEGQEGAITGLFSVLVAGSDMEEPVADITRGVLDGHIVLDREIAERGRFPAIDVARSVSRALPGAATAEERGLIAETRRLLGLYERVAPMVQTGLYQTGADAEADRAVAVFPRLDAWFSEATPEGASTEEAFARLAALLSGGG